MSATLNAWPLALYRFRVHMADELVLPAFSGALLRSVFGDVLKQQVCSGHQRQQACPEDCAYRILFNPVNQPGARFTDAAPPLIFRFPKQTSVAAGDCLEFTQVLLGPALDYLPLITDIWRKVFNRGVGLRQRRATGRLESVAMALPGGTWETIHNSKSGSLSTHQAGITIPMADAGGNLKLSLQTPMRLMASGKLLNQKTLNTESLARALLRRIQNTNQRYLHQSVPDWRQMQAWFEPVCLHAELSTLALSRYSRRQKQSMKLTAVLGHIQLTGISSELYPWLVLGQYLHLGKNSVFGLGQYHLSTLTE